MDASLSFDLVKAAETLLENAKKLAATAGAPTAKANRGNGAAPKPPGLHPGGFKDADKIRMSVVKMAKKIAFEVASPADVAKTDWVTAADIAAWNIFMQWKAFDKIPADGSSISYAELAKAIDAQESLVARIGGFLVSVGKLCEESPGSGRIRHSRVSPLYRSDHPFAPLATVAVGNGLKAYVHWPEYFERYGRREPRGQTHTPFGFAWGHPELPPWEVKALYPEYAVQFTKAMKSRQIVGGNMEVAGPGALYDMAWLGDEANAQRADDGSLVVDVGGGLGQLLRDVVSAIPAIHPDQCVLQDRKEVVEEALAVGDAFIRGVKLMDHDFHTKQPVKGALVYLLRRILLDYSDELATGILRQLADALPADNPKARVIIMEERLLDTPVPQNRVVDLVMLNLGGKLRNESMFADISRRAGLRVVKFHARDGDPTCVVECARSEEGRGGIGGVRACPTAESGN